MTSADLVRDFFLGFIRVHVLHHAAEEAVYGIALLAELRRHGYSVSPGTLYPLLHQLAEAGYLRQTDRTVNGKVRKYYVATPSGITALAAVRSKIGELVGELLEAPPTTPMRRPSTDVRPKRRTTRRR
jgi:PadR family transcriptional regulator PadR